MLVRRDLGGGGQAGGAGTPSSDLGSLGEDMTGTVAMARRGGADDWDILTRRIDSE